MDDYYQPDFYRFDEDSIILKNLFLLERISSKKDLVGAELGAGSGVISFEILSSLLIDHIDLIEVQSQFIPYLEKNGENFKGRFSIICKNFLDHIPKKKYDFIISNPPYFKTDQSRVSPSLERARCRFFIDANFIDFFYFSRDNLKAGGLFLFSKRKELEIPDEVKKYFDVKVLKEKGKTVFLRALRLDV